MSELKLRPPNFVPRRLVDHFSATSDENDTVVAGGQAENTLLKAAKNDAVARSFDVKSKQEEILRFDGPS